MYYDPPTAIRKLHRADPQLGALIRQIGAFGLSSRTSFSPFQELLRSIVYQQLSGRAAGAIHGRVKALFPNRRPSIARLHGLTDQSLRNAGLSHAKIAALRSLREHASAGTVPSRAQLHTMDDETIIERLTQIRGVGRWTVEMMLIFQLGRADILPATDLGIRKGFAYLTASNELPTPSLIIAYGERWRPYRSVASWYLWRASEL